MADMFDHVLTNGDMVRSSKGPKATAVLLPTDVRVP